MEQDGSQYGERASYFTISHIMEWFENLDLKYYEGKNTTLLQEKFNMAIHNISSSLNNDMKGKALSTFVGAIVNEKNTIISNVGDSRAYMYAKDRLHQLTNDDNVAYSLWKNGTIKEKDHIRFHKNSNQITKAMGSYSEVIPSSMVISNSDYTTLILCSDGITDCLSDDQIKAITRQTSIKELSKSLVNAAKTTQSKNNFSFSSEYKKEIKPGKDNISVAVLDNSQKRDDDEGR